MDQRREKFPLNPVYCRLLFSLSKIEKEVCLVDVELDTAATANIPCLKSKRKPTRAAVINIKASTAVLQHAE